MTQEAKELLLKDLCARLPYKPLAQWHHKALNKFRDVKIMKVSTYGKNIDDYHINILCQPEPGVDYEASVVDIKPYLRPLSSMTEEEYVYFMGVRGMNLRSYEIKEMMSENFSHPNRIAIVNTLGRYSQNIDWLNAHHFDYRGLIPKGLALKAPEGMYN